MVKSGSSEITALLRAWSEGDAASFDRLTAVLHDELRGLAHRYMRHERAGHTLQTTALVNEAYVRLIDLKGVDWHDRVHFIAVCAQVMRRILVDAARKRASAKRGGKMARADHSEAIDFEQLPAAGSDRATDLWARDGAVDIIGQMEPRRVKGSG